MDGQTKEIDTKGVCIRHADEGKNYNKIFQIYETDNSNVSCLQLTSTSKSQKKKTTTTKC